MEEMPMPLPDLKRKKSVFARGAQSIKNMFAGKKKKKATSSRQPHPTTAGALPFGSPSGIPIDPRMGPTPEFLAMLHPALLANTGYPGLAGGHWNPDRAMQQQHLMQGGYNGMSENDYIFPKGPSGFDEEEFEMDSEEEEEGE